jgi:hypothetical protein
VAQSPKRATNGRGFMMSTKTIIATHHGPTLIGLGLIVVLAAQVVPGIPLATGIALIGLGATHSLLERRQHEIVLVTNLCVYLSLAILAIGAQFHAHTSVLNIIDALLDAAILIRAFTTAILPHHTS